MRDAESIARGGPVKPGSVQTKPRPGVYDASDTRSRARSPPVTIMTFSPGH
jgi:hypothetical protein